MKSSLLEGLSNEDKELCKQQFNSSRRLREQLIRVLERKKEALLKDVVDEELLAKPNWELLVASKTAEVRSLDKIIGLL